MDGAANEGDDDATTVQRLMVTYLGARARGRRGPLRQEAIRVLRSGAWSRQALADMKKLDSFMRESQRLNPPTHLTFNAIVQEPVTLQDGVVLPEGAHIQMAAYSLGVDPERVQDPELLDGPRQYNNRKTPGQENWHRKWHCVSVFGSSLG